MYDYSELLRYIGVKPGFGYTVDPYLPENRIRFDLYGCTNEQLIKAIEYCETHEISYILSVRNDLKENYKHRTFLIESPVERKRMTKEEISECIEKYTPKKKKRK